ncbi:MAG: presenilin family intramembrane aspartyl protease PSH [Thermoplasmata archaeon]
MAREGVAILALAALLVAAHLVALVLARPFLAAEVQAFPDPNAVTNALLYFVLILAFTAFVLFAIRKRREGILKYVILGAITITMLFVFSVPLALAFASLPEPWASLGAVQGTLLLSFGLAYALLRYPEWWVVDITGFAVAAGVTAIIGISFGILPALVFLIGLAFYDAVAVYRTKHMIALADAVTGLRLPILLVVPKSLPYSFRSQPGLQEEMDEGGERAAMFMGLGDIIIPGILVVSAFAHLEPLVTILGVGTNLLVALATVVGTLLGFALLMRFVLSGRPQAGLPLLNTGAILAYLTSYYLLYRNLGFGIVFGL